MNSSTEELSNMTCWDHTSQFDNLTSGQKQFYHNIGAYQSVHGYLTIVVCTCGFLSNLANVIVLSQKKIANSSINFLMVVIAIAEMLLIAAYLPSTILLFIVNYVPDSDPYFNEDEFSIRFMQVSRVLVILFHFIAVWHTIAVAGFRWVMLSIANGKTILTMKNTRICSAVLIIANLLFAIPTWLDTQIISFSINYCEGGLKEFYTVRAKEDLNFNAPLFAVVAKFLPAVLLTALTIPLIHLMRTAEQNRIKLLSKGKVEESSRHQEYCRTTAMLLAVVMIFLLYELPEGVFLIYARTNRQFDHYYDLTRDMSEMIRIITFNGNFILYTTMSRQFRSTFVSLFCKFKLSNSAGVRRVSTMLTSLKPTTSNAQKRSNTCSNYSVNSINQRNNERGKPYEQRLNPAASSPLLMEDRSRNTCNSLLSDDISRSEEAIA
ncbi:dmsr-8 [Bugula neritina]|uniref:Dmsr-8 n=1 Tax=Bugula neritina TaxID=10212 RepID=A0A7J7JY58_BUGNE|nr:dmsr-8 [Bugula neritina]